MGFHHPPCLYVGINLLSLDTTPGALHASSERIGILLLLRGPTCWLHRALSSYWNEAHGSLLISSLRSGYGADGTNKVPAVCSGPTGRGRSHDNVDAWPRPDSTERQRCESVCAVQISCLAQGDRWVDITVSWLAGRPSCEVAVAAHLRYCSCDTEVLQGVSDHRRPCAPVLFSGRRWTRLLRISRPSVCAPGNFAHESNVNSGEIGVESGSCSSLCPLKTFLSFLPTKLLSATRHPSLLSAQSSSA